jgi:hypothetical protein
MDMHTRAMLVVKLIAFICATITRHSTSHNQHHTTPMQYASVSNAVNHMLVSATVDARDGNDTHHQYSVVMVATHTTGSVTV